MLGYIYDEDGNLCGTVTGHFVDVATMKVSDEYSLTYAYDLYSTTNHELLAYGPDSGYASTVYLTTNLIRTLLVSVYLQAFPGIG